MVTIIKKGLPKKALKDRIKKMIVKKGLDAYKYCGIISLKKDALLIQKELRDEWV
jgi:hypothetical protein